MVGATVAVLLAVGAIVWWSWPEPGREAAPASTATRRGADEPGARSETSTEAATVVDCGHPLLPPAGTELRYTLTLDGSPMGELAWTSNGCDPSECSFTLAGRGAAAMIHGEFVRACDEDGLLDPFAFDVMATEALDASDTDLVRWANPLVVDAVLVQRTRASTRDVLEMERRMTVGERETIRVDGQDYEAYRIELADRLADLDVATDEEARVQALLAASEQRGTMWLSPGIGMVRFTMHGGGHERTFELASER